MENNQVNLHCHTYLCKHAEGTVRDYCQKAVEQGLRVLGFSEHSPFPDNRYTSTRMFYTQLEQYCQAIDEARKEFPQLTILKGLEIDVDPEYPLEFYQKELKERLKLDYLSSGVHFVHDANGKVTFAGLNVHHPLEVFRMFMEKNIFLMKSGLFDYINHPDMIAASMDAWTPEIKELFAQVMQASVEYGVPVEINGYGLRKAEIDYPSGRRHPYPWFPVWEVAVEYNVACVVGSDAHRPQDVFGNMNDVFAIAEKNGLRCVNAELAERIIKRSKIGGPM